MLGKVPCFDFILPYADENRHFTHVSLNGRERKKFFVPFFS